MEVVGELASLGTPVRDEPGHQVQVTDVRFAGSERCQALGQRVRITHVAEIAEIGQAWDREDEQLSASGEISDLAVSVEQTLEILFRELLVADVAVGAARPMRDPSPRLLVEARDQPVHEDRVVPAVPPQLIGSAPLRLVERERVVDLEGPTPATEVGAIAVALREPLRIVLDEIVVREHEEQDPVVVELRRQRFVQLPLLGRAEVSGCAEVQMLDSGPLLEQVAHPETERHADSFYERVAEHHRARCVAAKRALHVACTVGVAGVDDVEALALAAGSGIRRVPDAEVRILVAVKADRLGGPLGGNREPERVRHTHRDLEQDDRHRQERETGSEHRHELSQQSDHLRTNSSVRGSSPAPREELRHAGWREAR